MNAYERALAAVTNQPLDRIPSAEIFIDKGVRKALCGSEDYMDFCDYIDLEVAITNTPSSLYRKNVITSYSIHYTKLYEPNCCELKKVKDQQ